MNAVLLTCIKRAPSFILKGKVESKNFIPLIENIEKEVELQHFTKEKYPDKYKFFKNLYYSYTNLKTQFPKKSTSHDIIKLLTSNTSVDMTGVWCKDLSIHRSSLMVAKAKNNDYPQSWGDPIEENPEIVIRIFLTEILGYLTLIRKMCELYSQDMIDNHKNIWNVIQNSKTPN